jgi:hypothetical protein
MFVLFCIAAMVVVWYLDSEQSTASSEQSMASIQNTVKNVQISDDGVSKEDVHRVLYSSFNDTKNVDVEVHQKLESGESLRTLWDFVNHFFSLPPGAKLSTESLLNYTFDVHMDFGNVTMNMTVDNVESDTKEVIDAVTQHELNDISDIVTLEDPLRLGSNEIKYVVCDKRRPQCRTYGSNVTSVNNADALAAHNDTSGRRLWVWKHRRRRFSINTGRVVGWATCTAGAAAHTYAWPPSAAAYATPGGQVAFYACKEGVRHGYNEIDGHGDTRRRRWFR